MSQDQKSTYSNVAGFEARDTGQSHGKEGAATSEGGELTASSDCQLAWESRWDGLVSPYILILGELPFLAEIAEYRTRRYRVPTCQKFCLSHKYPPEMAGYCAIHQNAFANLCDKDRLE